ncbi:hypothetical protein BGLT_04538 [Caballeronia glathei]|jgi:hypothetical protein|nr:hypothetical protein B0G84_1929 [Paraburkholderia sp. BL8N3]CDY75637.1 hypothetical protein BGLT_04538 [Caballeronia glathei]
MHNFNVRSNPKLLRILDSVRRYLHLMHAEGAPLPAGGPQTSSLF